MAVNAAGTVLVMWTSEGQDGSGAAVVGRRFHPACLPPVVVSEILSDPKLPARLEEVVLLIPTIEATSGYWKRRDGFARGCWRKDTRRSSRTP